MEKKNAIIIGASIIIGFMILGGAIIIALKDFTQNSKVNYGRYEMISNDSNLIILDTATGRYWRKYINPSEGPTDWTEEATDFFNK